MRKSSRQKNYDTSVSPGKGYLYKTRRLLFGLSLLTCIINLSLLAGFDESMGKIAIFFLVLSALFAIVQFLDHRKAHWSWPYIIVLSAIFLLLPAFGVFTTEVFFMRYVWTGEVVFYCGFTFLLLRKKKR